MTASLQQSLEAELLLVRQFIGILHTEAEVLGRPDHDGALNACTLEKNRCIEQLIDATHARENALSALGYSTDREGLETAATALPDLKQVCAELLDAGRQASELNAANGIIISTYLTHTQQALHGLRQLVGGQDLYDSSGRPHAVKGRGKTITAG